ncbi:WRKY domain-containing protein [Cephalotus follicularis]|uniref:WRKY domain-containing protein n=1 Tax=Cephalotus follicularis TaxID=3775 RepID=A0A1Q3CRI4_CEPFO|nr:WRKY domain-containing protein [Cephalotus follicularis]
MSSTSQAMLNQGLFEEQEMPAQMNFFSFPPNLTHPSLGCHHSLKPLTMPSLAADAPSITHLAETLILSSATHKQREAIASDLGGPQLLSLQRSSSNLRAWGDVDDCLASKSSVIDHDRPGISPLKMKKIKARRKVREPRFCFKTMSDVDVLDDGYKWRKYGQKVVKNTQHPRSYYRCTKDNCRVKKRVERLAEDPRMVITTYEGRHVHSPSHDMEDSQAQSQLNNFLW